MESFDEWLDTTKLRGYMDENSLEAAWEAGQQSKQAEVDELQKRINGALVQISNHHKSCVVRKKLKRMSASVSEISEIEVHELNMRALKNILKGDQS